MRYKNDYLKLLAMILMVLANYSKVVHAVDWPVIEAVAKIVFPIFIYQLALSMDITTNLTRIKKRILLLAVIAQPFFMIGLQVWHLNIAFTFLALIYLIEYRNSNKKYYIYLGLVLLELIIPLNIIAVLMGYLIYKYKDSYEIKAYIFFVYGIIMAWLTGDIWFLLSPLAVPIIYLFNFPKRAVNKYVFYVVYPVQYIIFYFINFI